MTIKPILISSTLTPPDNKPYLLDNSSSLLKAIRIGTGIYVPPQDIRNYLIPSGLVLKDIQEFLFMIQNKFTANGTELIGSKSVYEWKLNNPISYSQLLLYHSLLGNYNIVRSLLAIDYVERFEQLILSSDDSSPTLFVRSFLGETSYKNIKIKVKSGSDASWVSPEDGRLHTPLTDAISTQPEGNGNTFGQKQVDSSHAEFIILDEIVSKEPVLTDKELNRIHVLIRDQILEEYGKIKSSFDNLNTSFLYDSVYNGSNADEVRDLENEFGIISTQDLIDFDTLKELFNRLYINATGFNNSNPDASLRGVGTGNNGASPSVFEKLVSNAELGGIQFVRLGKEKPVIEDLVERKDETIIRKINGEDSLEVSDIL